MFRLLLLPLLLLTLAGLTTAGCGHEPPSERSLDPLVVADTPPPAIQGGTMAVSANGRYLAAADPDRDAVWIVNLDTETLIQNITLTPGDEPGRIEADAQGGFLVVLRGAGELLRLTPETFEPHYRNAVCAAPRGVDSKGDRVFVACAGGELLEVPLLGGELLNRWVLDRDLRDVVATNNLLFVSKFRSAEVLMLTEEGEEAGRLTPPSSEANVPGVAWRMIEHPRAEGILLLHQRARASSSVPVQVDSPGGYGGGGISCSPSLVQAAITHMTPTGVGGTTVLNDAVLPVDLAIPTVETFVLAELAPFEGRRGDDRDGSSPGRSAAPIAPPGGPSGVGYEVAVAAAGNLNNNTTSALAVGIAHVPTEASDFESSGIEFGGCSFQGARFTDGRQITAVATDRQGRLITQSRDPWEITIAQGRSIALPGADAKDSGHDLFHENSGGAIACASCHPGGGDDGQVWTFEGIGSRRTQNISGGILGTEPFHWEGDMQDFSVLTHEVFTERMGGPLLPPKYASAMADWIDTLPDRPTGTPVDVLAVERGRHLFESEETQCATCHGGPRLGNNDHVDVGTGLLLQVPSLLGVSMRAPFMHNGCANTMIDRFNPSCGGGDEHGITSHLSRVELADMSAYLDTL